MNGFTQPGAAFDSQPAVFAEAGTTYIAAIANEGRLYLLDAKAPGGADHKTPLALVPAPANPRFAAEAPATWRDQQGARWILAPARDAVAGYKVAAGSGTPSIAQT